MIALLHDQSPLKDRSRQSTAEYGIVLAGAHSDGGCEAGFGFLGTLVLTEPAVVEVAGRVVGEGAGAVGVVGEGGALFGAGAIGGGSGVAVGVGSGPHLPGPIAVGDGDTAG